MRLLLLAVLTVAVVATPARAGGVSLEGQLDCGMWIEARNNHQSSSFEHYLIGTLNGLSFGVFVEFWSAGGAGVSREAVYVWMDNYCRNKPLDQVNTAAIKLFSERTGWKRSP